MPLSETVLVIAGLLTVAMIAAGLCRNLPIPYTVLLVIIGLVLGEFARVWPTLEFLSEFQLEPDLVFFIFLPALIFESGYNLNARQLIKDLIPVLVLAVPALLISTALVGWGLSAMFGMPLMIALLFGALISATDPVAVVALFKELGAPQRLTVLVEGESLLNDATAIVVFSILLSMAMAGAQIDVGSAALAVLDFLRVFLGGALVGVAVGFFFCELQYRLRIGTSGILIISIVIAYTSFILAEHTLHVSGVMASASAALTLGVYGSSRVPEEAAHSIGETWELIALASNSMLFLLVGLSVNPVDLALRGNIILVAVLLVMIARAATVYSMVPATTRLFRLPTITPAERHIMWWGGLKGGLAIAIVLSIPEQLAGRSLLLDMTLGVVLFTLLVNAPTIRPLMVRIGLNKMTANEQAELKQGLIEAREAAGRVLEEFESNDILTRAEEHRIRKHLAASLESNVPLIGREQQTRQAYLHVLKTEQEKLNELYEVGVISQYTYFEMRTNIQNDREARSRSLEGSSGGTRSSSLFLRFERSVLRRLREKNWASGVLSRYQSLRLAQHLQHHVAGILTSVHALETLDARTDLDPDQKNEIARAYRDRLQSRRQRVAEIRSEFPDFYDRFVSNMCNRVAFQSAARRAKLALAHGEVSAKALADIERRIHAALEEIPALNEPLPTLSSQELINLVPLFSELSEDALSSLAGHAHSVTFLPGDTIIGEHERGDALYVITRGRVEVERNQPDGSRTLLAELREGDFFGETALLGDHVRTATVKAAIPTTLLRLARRDVLSLAKKNAEVKRRLEIARTSRRADATV